MEKLDMQDLRENKDWKKAVIVFKQESFEQEYSEESRSYQISRDNYYFQWDKISSSLFGYCLDGTDNGVRLDIYMSKLLEEGGRWLVEYCYIIE